MDGSALFLAPVQIILTPIYTCSCKGLSFIQTAKLAESEGAFRVSGRRPGSNLGPRAPKRVR